MKKLYDFGLPLALAGGTGTCITRLVDWREVSIDVPLSSTLYLLGMGAFFAFGSVTMLISALRKYSSK